MERVIICIGRQFGSGGRAVAKAISEKTGIPVYDNDVLVEAAKEFGYSPDIFHKRDEKHHLFGLARTFSSSAYNADNFLGDNILFRMQCKAIQNIAQKGSCIIVGRAADYVLREDKDLVSVFLWAPLEDRLERVMRRMDLKENEARKVIARKDGNRRNFYNGYTLGNWGEASNYDLCLNSSALSIEGTADVIIDFARRVKAK